MSMAFAWPIAAPISWPISSLVREVPLVRRLKDAVQRHELRNDHFSHNNPFVSPSRLFPEPIKGAWQVRCGELTGRAPATPTAGGRLLVVSGRFSPNHAMTPSS